MSIVLSSRAVTFVAALFAAACALAHGERGDPRDSLIIYSGFGYISEDAQPDLSALLFSSKPEFALPGDQLSESAAEAVSREFSQERLKRWSPHGVITSRGELDAILSRILGRTSGPEDRNKIFEMFDHVYALMFIGGLEYDAGQEASFAEAAADITQIKESWPIRHQYAITSTIAVLFDLKRNEIVASATQIGFEHAVGTNAELSQTSRVARLAKSYASGATGSAATLAGLLKKLTPQRDARDAGFERYSVTDAWIVQEANALTSLFGWKSAARPQNSICQRSMQCSEPGGNCEKLIGLMIHGMTASLSRAGFLTEPALHWSDWRASAAYQTTVTLSMGRVREQPIELRVLSMPQRPNAADVKVMPVLMGAEIYTDRPKGGPFETRSWTSMLRYVLVRTDPADCTTTVSRIQRPEVKRPTSIGRGPRDIGPVGRKPSPPDMDRLQILLAVQNALDQDVVKDLQNLRRTAR